MSRVGFELDVDILLVSSQAMWLQLMLWLPWLEKRALIRKYTRARMVHFVSQLGARLLFIVWFDHASSLGLVKLAIDKATKGLVETLHEIDRMSAANANRLLNTQNGYLKGSQRWHSLITPRRKSIARLFTTAPAYVGRQRICIICTRTQTPSQKVKCFLLRRTLKNIVF